MSGVIGFPLDRGNSDILSTPFLPPEPPSHPKGKARGAFVPGAFDTLRESGESEAAQDFIKTPVKPSAAPSPAAAVTIGPPVTPSAPAPVATPVSAPGFLNTLLWGLGGPDQGRVSVDVVEPDVIFRDAVSSFIKLATLLNKPAVRNTINKLHHIFLYS